MNKKIISAVAAVGITFGSLVAAAPAQAEEDAFVKDPYPVLWWSECVENRPSGYVSSSNLSLNKYDGVITWRTNSRALRVPMVKKVFADLSVQMPNFTFKQVSWWNRKANITVGFSTKLKSSGWAWLRGRSYSNVGDIRRVVTRQPFKSYNDTVVEYILRHELWHALGMMHQSGYVGLMNPYWNFTKANMYANGLIPAANDFAYASWVNSNCSIDQPVAYSKRFKEKDVLKMRGGPKGNPKVKLKRLP